MNFSIKTEANNNFCSLFFVQNEDPQFKIFNTNLNPELKSDFLKLSKEKAFQGDFADFLPLSYLKNGQIHWGLAAGIGKTKSFNGESLRQLAGSLYKTLKTLKISELSIHFSEIKLFTSLTENEIIRSLTEGFILSSYQFTELKSTPQTPSLIKEIEYITHDGGDSQFSALKEAELISQMINLARSWGDKPGSHMTPEDLHQEAKKIAQGTALKVTAWDKQKIIDEKFNGLYSVSKGSDTDPRFIIMEYNGHPNKEEKPLCFVGKGLTFDSGGISIKPSAKMEEMKYDMCGGAAVIATLGLVAQLKLKVNVVGLIPACENLPGPKANKPGDIITSHHGKTVEVNNTDAEGRLILMDALSYAKKFNPAAIFDIATLTGAIIVSLGNIYTGLFTQNTDLLNEIKAASENSGELLWPLPLHSEHVKDMKGTYGDLSNISSSGGAGSSTAAAFLSQFVEESTPWAHFDIAGTAWNAGDRLSYNPSKGATGVMIRTFVELARKRAIQ